MEVSEEDCEKLIQEYEPVPTNKEESAMSIDGKRPLITQPENELEKYYHNPWYAWEIFLLGYECQDKLKC